MPTLSEKCHASLDRVMLNLRKRVELSFGIKVNLCVSRDFFLRKKLALWWGDFAVVRKTRRQGKPRFAGAVLLSGEPRTTMGGRVHLRVSRDFFLRKKLALWWGHFAVVHKTRRQGRPRFAGAVLLSGEPRKTLGGESTCRSVSC